ncbi:MAG TPA: amidase [Bacteroidota bacterium]|nr:amidase [Bacteroidota bacterium]
MHRQTKYILITGFACCAFFLLGALVEEKTSSPITRDAIASAEKLFGLNFTNAKRDSMIDGLKDQLTNYQNIRKITLANNVPPALALNPIPVGMKFESLRRPFMASPAGTVAVPANLDNLAFSSVGQLAELIRTRKVTSLQLTTMYLNRLKRYGPKLLCIVTLTEDLAMRQAKQADAEIAAGKYRGPLHGIPFGIKDLLATKTYKTTWGAAPYRNQLIDEDATVVRRLEDAGAVLVAKLSMGELAMDDVWFGGMTRNPWNYKEGSSGSSAGSACATSAGLVAFAIGTETWGSIVSPSTVCGTTGLRPTYGRVSRTGAMALAWSMDKIGPICRTVEDCALVFNAIYGPDGKDQTLYDVPFNYSPKISLSTLKIGYLKNDFDSVKTNRENNDSSFAVLKRLGAKLIPVTLPSLPINDMSIILTAEAGASFDELTRSGRDSMLARQAKDSWPNIFRSARFIPAVEYIQANRVRYLAIQDMAKLMGQVDVIVAPPFDGDNSLLTNLTGHPCVVVPNGFSKKGTPTSITFLGKLFDEATLLAVAKQYQDATDFHLKHPKLEE